MPLTSAERQKRYRERLKMENPDKYEEYRKKAAESSKRYHREKVGQYTDEEKEKLRQKWRDAKGKTCTADIAAKQKPLTPAERQKRYRERLKMENPDKYEEYKKKAAESSKRYHREKVSQYTDEEREKMRQKWRDAKGKTCTADIAVKQKPLTLAERQKRYREKLKRENPDKYEENRKKIAENARHYYREKASEYTENEKEKRRQQWRDARKLSSAKTQVKKKVRRALTSAERQRRYREKLKKENPEKYLELKKKNADKSRQYYREKVSPSTGDELLKRDWNVTRKALEKMKRYRERLKRQNPTKYRELMRRSTEYSKLYREKAKLYTEEEKEKRRQVWREAKRINKMRKQSKRKCKQVDSRKSSDEESSSEQEAEPGPAETPIIQWHNPDPDSPGVSDNQQDPLCRIDQCRFCGDFNKDCVVVSSTMPYLADHTITIALNHTSVQLDFSGALPNTVCKNCDAKLQEICDFIRIVKDVQESMKTIKIEREDTDVRDTDFIKIEAEENEDGINSISITDTVFVKKVYKRKSDVDVKKKIKVAKTNIMVEFDEFASDIKEEIIDDNEHVDSRLSDTGSETLSIPDELKQTYDLDSETEDNFSVNESNKKEEIRNDINVKNKFKSLIIRFDNETQAPILQINTTHENT